MKPLARKNAAKQKPGAPKYLSLQRLSGNNGRSSDTSSISHEMFCHGDQSLTQQ